MRADDLRMKRKVQQLGSSTLAVTVPADWARQHDIEKGDEIVVQRDENGGSLLLVPDHPAAEDVEATIDADALDADALRRAVVTQYVLGRRLVRVESDRGLEADHFDAVFDAERRLMGLGVVEEDVDRVVVRCSVAPDDFELATLLGRLGRTETSIRESAVRALATGDEELARRSAARRSQVQKLFFLLLRLVFATYRDPRLNQAVGLDTGFPLIGYRSVVQDTALMAGIARDLAQLVLDRDVSHIDDGARSRVRALSDAVGEAASATREAVMDPSYDRVEAARAAVDAAEARGEEANAHLEDERPEPLLILQRAVSLLCRDVRHVRDSLDVATHLAFRADPDLVTRE